MNKFQRLLGRPCIIRRNLWEKAKLERAYWPQRSICPDKRPIESISQQHYLSSGPKTAIFNSLSDNLYHIFQPNLLCLGLWLSRNYKPAKWLWAGHLQFYRKLILLRSSCLIQFTGQACLYFYWLQSVSSFQFLSNQKQRSHYLEVYTSFPVVFS